MSPIKKTTFCIDLRRDVLRCTFDSRSFYTVEVRPGFLCLTDMNIGRTLTNNAAVVIEDVLRNGYDVARNRVVYRDTDGIWDEMLVVANTFAGFRAIRCADLETAIIAAVKQAQPDK